MMSKLFAKLMTAVVFAGMTMCAAAEGVPKVFGQYLLLDTVTKGEVVVVMPPREISKYVAKVEEAAVAKPEWFKEYSAKAKPGVPLPFHENLGLTKEEYAKYIELWNQRKARDLCSSFGDGRSSDQLCERIVARWFPGEKCASNGCRIRCAE